MRIFISILILSFIFTISGCKNDKVKNSFENEKVIKVEFCEYLESKDISDKNGIPKNSSIEYTPFKLNSGLWNSKEGTDDSTDYYSLFLRNSDEPILYNHFLGDTIYRISLFGFFSAPIVLIIRKSNDLVTLKTLVFHKLHSPQEDKSTKNSQLNYYFNYYDNQTDRFYRFSPNRMNMEKYYNVLRSNIDSMFTYKKNEMNITELKILYKTKTDTLDKSAWLAIINELEKVNKMKYHYKIDESNIMILEDGTTAYFSDCTEPPDYVFEFHTKSEYGFLIFNSCNIPNEYCSVFHEIAKMSTLTKELKKEGLFF